MARILIISPEPAALSGGVERFCGLLKDALIAAGHDVRIAGPHHKPGRWATRVALKPLLESASVPMRLKEWEPDLVITNGFLGNVRHKQVAPVIHVFHGTMIGHAWKTGRGEPWRQRLRAGIGGAIAEALAARGALRVAVSNQAAAEVRRFYRLAVDEVIPHGVDTRMFRRGLQVDARRSLGLQEHEHLALFVGRVEAGKAPYVALEGACRAGYELIVAGRQPIRGARYMGEMAPDTLAALYTACDCVVFPTRYEACSYVVLEALASGVPLITTEVGWMGTFLEQVPEYRCLVTPPDPAAIATALRGINTPPVEMAVDLAYKWIHEHNSIERFAKRWRAVVDSVLSSPERASEHSLGSDYLESMR